LALKRDLMLVGGGRLAAALMALITLRAVTTFLTPEQYGELALLIAVQMFCGLFLINPVGQHINLHTHAWWDEGSLMVRLKSYRYYVLAVSLLGAAVGFYISKQHSAEQLFWAAAAVFAMVAAGTWNATLIPMLNMLGFRAASVLWSIVTVAIGLISSILLVRWSPSATAWFSGQAIGMAAGALGAKYVLRRHAIPSKSSRIALSLLDRHTVLTYCMPLALATGLMWLQLSGYRFVIEGYWGLSQLGFLAVGLQLAGQIWSLAESLAMQFLYPLFYRRVSAHEKHAEVRLAVSDLLNTLVPVYFVLAGLTILSAPYLLKLLVAPQFWGALDFVMLGTGIELCRVLGNLLSNAAHVRRKTKSLALPYAAGSMTALALIYFAGTRQMEISWAGAALMAGAIAMFIIMLISMYRQVRFCLDVGRCFVGVAAMLAMASLVIWMPKVSGLGATLGLLMLAAAPAGIVVSALLWKNPATLRLLNVQLRKN
jgi:O-antigen/teichoic acid export membrane protein